MLQKYQFSVFLIVVLLKNWKISYQ